MKNFKLDRNKAMFMFIDMQPKILKAIDNNERVLKNSIILAKICEILDMDFVVTAQYLKGLGSNHEEILKHLKNYVEHSKLTFDSTEDEEILKDLKAKNKKQIIVCGIESHICILQTVRGLLEKGYEVFVASDALGSRSDFNHQNGLSQLDQMGAVISNTETILFDLAGVAGTDTFKKLQALIK